MGRISQGGSGRDHRAFGGFSLGSVTTWLAFCHDTDYIRYFLPMSGSCWYYGGYGDFQFKRNVDFIENLVKTANLGERGYFIYHAVGTADNVKYQSEEMAREMLSRKTFTSEHYVFFQKTGGHHDFTAVQEFMYNALPLFLEGVRNLLHFFLMQLKRARFNMILFWIVFYTIIIRRIYNLIFP